MNEAKEIIQKWLTAERIPELEFGAIYTAKIVEIREIGVMLQIHPDMQPVLLHLSHLDTKKVILHVMAYENVKNGYEILICNFLTLKVTTNT